jgi:hypothetical protein
MQDNAWADERVMLEWHKVFQADTASLGREELLLGLDNHGAQQTVTLCVASVRHTRRRWTAYAWTQFRHTRRRWTAYAWTQLRLRSEFLRASFVSTGFLVRADQSEGHLIRVKGFKDYKIHIII